MCGLGAFISFRESNPSGALEKWSKEETDLLVEIAECVMTHDLLCAIDAEIEFEYTDSGEPQCYYIIDGELALSLSRTYLETSSLGPEYIMMDRNGKIIARGSDLRAIMKKIFGDGEIRKIFKQMDGIDVKTAYRA